VLWRINESCNLNCPFCEYRRTLRRPRRSVRAEDVLAFGRTLSHYANETGREVLLSFLGGEPTLWPPLWEVSRTLHQDHGLALSLTTNGATLSPEQLHYLANHYAEVTFSIDGDAAFHENLRGAPGLYPRLRAAIETLSKLKSAQGRGPLIRVNTVLMRSNIHVFESLATQLAAWGVEALTFNALGGTPGDPFYDRERLTPDHLAWLSAALPSLRARLAAQGLHLQGSEAYLHRLAHTAQGLPLPIADCAPGQTFLFINESGQASPCSFTTAEYGLPISTLQTPADLAALPARFNQARQASQAAACSDCPSTQVFGKFSPASELPILNSSSSRTVAPLSLRERGRG
jgi:MoaA/NifB/PqqE/SkfB family radical SAM enzyme